MPARFCRYVGNGMKRDLQRRRDGEMNSPLRCRKRGQVPGLRETSEEAGHLRVSEGRPRLTILLGRLALAKGVKLSRMAHSASVDSG